MASAPSRTDFYAVLGVEPSASGDDIARAFRTRAKRLHPDTNPDPAAAAQFNELVLAYEVLSNHRARREYDRTALDRTVLLHPAAAPAPVAPRGTARWSRRRAWTSVVAGALVTLLGFGAAYLTWHLHERDAHRRAAYRAVVATRLPSGDITFTTADGRVVETREPEQHGEGNGVGPTVSVRYDPADPQRVVVDSSSIGRDITLSIVALKFLVGGPVFFVLGVRRLRMRPAALRAVR